jgi:hypothetical protein
MSTNTAQVCLKTALKVAFKMMFFILYKYEIEIYMLYLQGEKVCVCGLAEVLVRNSQ